MGAQDPRTHLTGSNMRSGTITIPASSGSAADLKTLMLAGLSAGEDTEFPRIMAWRIFKEKDSAMGNYNISDDASETVAEAFGDNEPVTSDDYPVNARGLDTIFIQAADDAAITAGFRIFLAPNPV